MEPREQVQAAQDEIDQLNAEKSSIQKAWEGEVERTGDPLLPKPPKLRSLNQELYHQYTYRDNLLKKYPELQAEFGTPGRKRNKQKSFAVTRASVSAADRARRKKKIHTDFKAWCAAQRPQIKCSLENWEDEAIQLRFLSDKVLPQEFEAWCGRVGIAFNLVHARNPELTEACMHWKDFEEFCKDVGFPANLTNYRNEDIDARFEEWQVERDLQEELEKKRREEAEAQFQAEQEAKRKAQQAAWLKEEVDKLPPSFSIFAVQEWDIAEGDHSAILLLWQSKDETVHELYQDWFKEKVEAQKAS